MKITPTPSNFKGYIRTNDDEFLNSKYIVAIEKAKGNRERSSVVTTTDGSTYKLPYSTIELMDACQKAEESNTTIVDLMA